MMRSFASWAALVAVLTGDGSTQPELGTTADPDLATELTRADLHMAPELPPVELHTAAELIGTDMYSAPAFTRADLHSERDPHTTSDTIQRYTLAPERTTVSFFARGTLGSFTGTTSDVRGWLELRDTVALVGAHGEVEIELATLRTGMGVRDGDTRSTLETERYPVASFALRAIESSESDSLTRRGTITGDLTVHGQSRESAFATSFRFSADTLFASGEAQVRLSDFGITRRRRFLGLLSVDDQVGLAFEAMFVREGRGGVGGRDEDRRASRGSSAESPARGAHGPTPVEADTTAGEAIAGGRIGLGQGWGAEPLRVNPRRDPLRRRLEPAELPRRPPAVGSSACNLRR